MKEAQIKAAPKTYADLFTGFGGATVGAMAAGLQPLWGIEYRPDVAEVANANLGGHVRVADILDCDPAQFERVDVLHASPPCPNFSVAKAGAVETVHDLALAGKVSEFVRVLLPDVFTLENVYGYRNSQSWSIIRETLHECGYWLALEHVNAADYGVPQSRKRMIVRAVRGGWVPHLPQPAPWVGWYAAIEDLLDTLPESQFAPWQLERLPDIAHNSLLLPVNGEHSSYRHSNATAPTITTDTNQFGVRAFLFSSENSRPNGKPTILAETEPSSTVRSGRSSLPRAWLPQGRVVSMTPRALARFQSFPDWYELPEKRSLAAYGIGNAVPALMYERIIEQLVCTVPVPCVADLWRCGAQVAAEGESET